MSFVTLPVVLAALLGLLVGRLLHAFAAYLPQTMQRTWLTEAVHSLHVPDSASNTDTATSLWEDVFGPGQRPPQAITGAADLAASMLAQLPRLRLAWWRSPCTWPACSTPAPRRWRALWVELVTAALAGYCAMRYGMSGAAAAWFGFGALLLCLALIDWDTTYLPDPLTLPLLWSGLLASSLGWTGVSLSHAVWGAAAGYVSLWLVFWIFKQLTHKDGMGYGDFKLFAALGAWLGLGGLIPAILIASLSGALVGIGLKATRQLRHGGYVPFGPFLAVGGYAVWCLGTPRLLQWVGLGHV